MKRFWATLLIAALPLAVATTATAGPAHGGPAHGGPALGGPALGGPALGGPAPAMYHGVALGVLGDVGSSAKAMNNRDEVVGYGRDAYQGNHPFLWRNGTMMDLGLPPGAVDAMAVDINDRGQVIGLAQTPSATTFSWFWENGVWTPLNIPGDNTFAEALNNRGEVVGIYQPGDEYHGFVWKNGKFSDLGTTKIVDINDSGQMVGSSTDASGKTRGQFLDRGKSTYIDVLPTAINNSGWVSGDVPTIDFSRRSAVWRAGTTTLLPEIADNYSETITINDRGDVLGRVYTEAEKFHAYLWRAGRTYDLLDYGIDLYSVPGTGLINSTTDLNNRSHIAATLVFMSPSNGQPNAYLYR